MSQAVTVFNPTDTVVVVDTDGHLLPGRSYASVTVGSPVVAAAIARGALLVLSDDPPRDLAAMTEAARAAFEQTRAACGTTPDPQVMAAEMPAAVPYEPPISDDDEITDDEIAEALRPKRARSRTTPRPANQES